jgi:hypothetical protein
VPCFSTHASRTASDEQAAIVSIKAASCTSHRPGMAVM